MFGISLPCSLQENKENAKPNESSDDDSSGDGPILYRDDNLDSKLIQILMKSVVLQSYAYNLLIRVIFNN